MFTENQEQIALFLIFILSMVLSLCCRHDKIESTVHALNLNILEEELCVVKSMGFC